MVPLLILLAFLSPLVYHFVFELKLLNMLLFRIVLSVFALSNTVFAHPKHNSVPKLGAVASESATCSKIGIDVLKSGGNAADAVGSSTRPIDEH